MKLLELINTLKWDQIERFKEKTLTFLFVHFFNDLLVPHRVNYVCDDILDFLFILNSDEELLGMASDLH